MATILLSQKKARRGKRHHWVLPCYFHVRSRHPRSLCALVSVQVCVRVSHASKLLKLRLADCLKRWNFDS